MRMEQSRLLLDRSRDQRRPGATAWFQRRIRRDGQACTGDLKRGLRALSKCWLQARQGKAEGAVLEYVRASRVVFIGTSQPTLHLRRLQLGRSCEVLVLAERCRELADVAVDLPYLSQIGVLFSVFSVLGRLCLFCL